MSSDKSNQQILHKNIHNYFKTKSKRLWNNMEKFGKINLNILGFNYSPWYVGTTVSGYWINYQCYQLTILETLHKKNYKKYITSYLFFYQLILGSPIFSFIKSVFLFYHNHT